MEFLNNIARRRVLYVFFLIAAGAILYGGTLSYKFVWDDLPSVAENRKLDNAGSILTAFSTDYWELQDVPQKSGYYRPVSMVSFVVTSLLFGRNPLPHRAVSLLLFLINAVLLFKIISFVSKYYWIPLAVAVAWIVHPMSSETVLFVSARPDLLYVLFLLLSMLSAVRWLISGSRRWLITIFFLFWAACLSKETAVVGLLLIPLYCRLYAVEHNYKMRLLPLIAALVAALTMAIFARYFVLGMSFHRLPFEGSLIKTWLTIPSVVVFYISKAFLPLNISPVYNFKIAVSLSDALFIFYFILLCLIFTAVVLLTKSRLTARFGFIWFAIAILPYLNVIPTGVLVANRYVYFALPGLFIFVAEIMNDFYGKDRKPAAVAIRSSIILWMIFISIQTLLFEKAWQDECSLWEFTLDKAPDSPVALNHVGNCMFESNNLKSAEDFYQRALNIRPEYSEARLNLARAKMRVGDINNAKALVTEVLERNDKNAEALDLMGSIELASGNGAASIEFSKRAVEIEPFNWKYRYNLAVALLYEKKFSKAAAELKKVVKLHPDNPSVWINMAAALTGMRDFNAALEAYNKVFEYTPNSSIVHLNKAVVLAAMGKIEEAEKEWKMYAAAGGKDSFESVLQRAGAER